MVVRNHLRCPRGGHRDGRIGLADRVRGPADAGSRHSVVPALLRPRQRCPAAGRSAGTERPEGRTLDRRCRPDRGAHQLGLQCPDRPDPAGWPDDLAGRLDGGPGAFAGVRPAGSGIHGSAVGDRLRGDPGDGRLPGGTRHRRGFHGSAERDQHRDAVRETQGNVHLPAGRRVSGGLPLRRHHVRGS